MTSQHQQIHERCVRLCGELIRIESEIVAQLQLVQKFKIHLKFQKKNLFLYAKDVCGLSDNQAYAFSSLAKCVLMHPQLDEAIQSKRLAVSKASRLVSTLNRQNATELIDFACQHSKREIEREVRRLNPKASVPATIKPLSESLDVLNTPIVREASDDIRKAMDLLAQQYDRNVDIGEAIALVFADFVERRDPVKRAERAKKREESKSKMAPRVKTEESYPHFSARAEKLEQNGRSNSLWNRSRQSQHQPFAGPSTASIKPNDEPLTAAQIHQVNLRDGRQCTSLDSDGHRCPEKRWLHYHHIISRANGGSNESENLTTLCSFHHDLVHQLSFAMDGGVNYIRDRSVAYG